MRVMAWLLIAGCDLSVTSGPALVATWERDCIRTLDTGSTTPLGNTIVLTSACTDASLVEHVAYYDDVLTQVSSGTQPGYRYQRVVLAEIDDGPGPDVVGVVDEGRG